MQVLIAWVIIFWTTSVCLIANQFIANQFVGLLRVVGFGDIGVVVMVMFM